MPTNDQANEMNHLKAFSEMDFEKFKFSELEDNELFWQTNIPGDNIPWRKTNETQALNIKAQTTHKFQSNTVVWQKI